MLRVILFAPKLRFIFIAVVHLSPCRKADAGRHSCSVCNQVGEMVSTAVPRLTVASQPLGGSSHSWAGLSQICLQWQFWDLKQPL